MPLLILICAVLLDEEVVAELSDPRKREIIWEEYQQGKDKQPLSVKEILSQSMISHASDPNSPGRNIPEIGSDNSLPAGDSSQSRSQSPQPASNSPQPVVHADQSALESPQSRSQSPQSVPGPFQSAPESPQQDDVVDLSESINRFRSHMELSALEHERLLSINFFNYDAEQLRSLFLDLHVNRLNVRVLRMHGSALSTEQSEFRQLTNNRCDAMETSYITRGSMILQALNRQEGREENSYIREWSTTGRYNLPDTRSNSPTQTSDTSGQSD